MMNRPQETTYQAITAAMAHFGCKSSDGVCTVHLAPWNEVSDTCDHVTGMHIFFLRWNVAAVTYQVADSLDTKRRETFGLPEEVGTDEEMDEIYQSMCAFVGEDEVKKYIRKQNAMVAQLFIEAMNGAADIALKRARKAT